MHDSVKYLKNGLEGETDILHEYFVPRAQFVAFVDGVRAVLKTRRANLLNASVRVVHREDNTLTYAPTEMFAVVLYMNQTTDAAGHAHMRALTGELIDVATGLGGTFFLPYQLHYTSAPIRRSRSSSRPSGSTTRASCSRTPFTRSTRRLYMGGLEGSHMIVCELTVPFSGRFERRA